MDPTIIYNNSRSRAEFIRNMNNDPNAGRLWDRYKSWENSSTVSNTSSIDTGGLNSGIMGTIGKLFNSVNNKIKGTFSFIDDVYASQIGQATSTEDSLDVLKKLIEYGQKGGLNPLSLGFNAIGDVKDTLLNQIKQESELRNDINSRLTITGELSEQIREDMKNSSISAAEFGYNLSEISEIYSGLVEQSGKFSLVGNDILDKSAPIARVLNMTTRDLAITLSEFEKIGLGVNDTLDYISSAVIRSLSLGLSSKKITTELQANIGKLNEYGFKNGIEGLEKMVQKSVEFRVNLNDVFKIADTVFSPEKAIDLSANLQVLGGAIGAFNDPIKLMYMATNNVEGLQDALIGAASSLATYNSEQGKFEITGVNLRRSKEMADAFGMSMGELNKVAIATAERVSATTALMSNSFSLDEEQKEFLINLARMDKGEMKITIPRTLADSLGLKDTKVSLENMNKDIALAILKNQDSFKEMNIKEIANKQLTETQQMSRDMAVVGAYYRVRGAELLKGVAKGTGGEAMEELRKIILEQKKDINNTRFNNIENKGVKFGATMRETLAPENLMEGIKKMEKNVTGGNEVTKVIEKTIKVVHEFTSDVALDVIRRTQMQNPGFGLRMLDDTFEEVNSFLNAK
jgi:hypothetical protein